MIAKGKRQLAKARNVSAVCRGPATAFIATCSRLKWIMKAAVTVITDDGKLLQFHLDSPAAMANQVKETKKLRKGHATAGKMWEWKRSPNGASV